MSVSANTPHLAATWCSCVGRTCSAATSSRGMPTLIRHLSIVAPVPDAHLSFIDAIARLVARLSVSLNMMILASWPPSSITLPTSGCSCSTAIVTALTSCTNFAPSGAASGPAPEPVMKMRMWSSGTCGNASPIGDEQLQHLLGLPRLVALVVGPEDRSTCADRPRRLSPWSIRRRRRGRGDRRPSQVLIGTSPSRRCRRDRSRRSRSRRARR